MMKNVKLQKGITLISLSIAVIVILIITGTIIYNVKGNLGIHRLQNMQTDIANIREKVLTYYAEYGAIPVEHEYTNETNLNKIDVISEAVDTGKFYVVELTSLDNLTLNYGKDYEKIRKGEATTQEQINELTDIYIINADSNNIFYVKGINYDSETFYTDYTVDDVDTKALSLKTMIEACASENMYSRTENTVVKDEYGNEITIPAGFRVVIDDTTNNAKNVTEGIVIQDEEGNQFVWVPVGKIYTTADEATKESTAKTINLSRYEFADGTSSYTANDGTDLGVLAKGTPIDRGKNEISIGTTDTIIEDTSVGENTHALDIDDYKSKTNKAGGYYIARYEASYGRDGKANSKISTNYSELVAPTEEGTLWNFITQANAATASRKMYEGETNFTSDLINSYAWDTAIVFIQTFGGENYATYSYQNSLNGQLSNTGQNGDNPININDMASNASELTTETISIETIPCTVRGGYCIDSNYYTAYRYYLEVHETYYFYTFRPILYL